ncbi:uncharacterized protein N0V89_010067 [Didymosphaeria variabile]|uniref:Uncharacterized protein n=1 Tax=Didymosphaeria variabile TaxID=1932322 RepID=A0A9W9C8R0_9PLEO|nr:uncharacterized protein N0V89_010067 [Didymosphaeria variabile]KAJ4348689.1 hypothetical protein N0V89_010067 [Didymosphaeria variabile]
MRAPNVALFLLSLLVLYTISAPVEEKNGLTNFLDGPVFVKSLLPGRSGNGEHFQARDLISKEQDIGPDLDKRRGGRGGSRSRTKKPARKRPQRKKKPAPKKKPAQRKKKPSTKSPKKPNTRKPTAKKPKKQAKACKPAKGVKGKNGKLSGRAQPAGESCPPKKKVTKTRNYKIAEKAAKKAGHKLVLGESYLLRFKSKPGLVNHQALIVGTVKHRRVNPNDGALHFEASSSELTKPLNVPVGRIAAAKEKCRKMHGAKCKHRGIEKVYDCKQTLNHWGKKSEFLFKGNADPEFADPKTFVQTGEAILERDTTYDVVYNNCGTHARKLENVAKLKKGQDPLVDVELQDLENLTLEEAA